MHMPSVPKLPAASAVFTWAAHHWSMSGITDFSVRMLGWFEMRWLILVATAALLILSGLFFLSFHDARLAHETLRKMHFHAAADQQTAQLNRILATGTASLARLHSYVSSLREVIDEVGLENVRTTLSDGLRQAPEQFSHFFALQPRKAKQYFGAEAALAAAYRDSSRLGAESVTASAQILFKVWRDNHYLNNDRETWYLQNKQNEGIHITSFYYDKHYLKKWLFSLTQGLYEKGQFQGVVGVRILASDILDTIEHAELGARGGLLLMDLQTGTLLSAAGDEQRYGLIGKRNRMEFNLLNAFENNREWKQSLKNHGAELSVQGQDNRNYWVSARHLEHVPWALVAFQDQKEIRHDAASGMLYLGIATTVLAMASAWLLLYLFYVPSRQLHQDLVRWSKMDGLEELAPFPHPAGMEMTQLRDAAEHFALRHAEVAQEQNENARQLLLCKQHAAEQMLEINVLRDELAQSQVDEKNARLRLNQAQAEARQWKATVRKIHAYARKAGVVAQQAQFQARQANRVKSHFLANMNHELRTPLNAIIGYTEILQEDAEEMEYPEFIPDLQKIHGASFHLLDLINNLFDLSKIESSRIDLYIETFDIMPMLQDVAQCVQPLLDRQQNSLKINAENPLGTMTADLTKVRQNLLNLLTNAGKFAKKSDVQLTIHREHSQNSDMDWVVFKVSDHGIGMTQEQIRHIFEYFPKTHSAMNHRPLGAGLGLPITRQFCEIMGGTIEVESELGKGSIFTMRLPADVSVAVDVG